MNKLLLHLVLILLPVGYTAATESLINVAEMDLYKVWFANPKPHQTLRIGTNLTVKVGTAHPSQVKKMYLYLNGKYLGALKQAPFHFNPSDPSFSELKGLKMGTYKLRVKITTVSGNVTYKDCKFYVGNGGGELSPNPVRCFYGNPMQTLPWLKSYVSRKPKVKVEQYSKSGVILFRIRPCHKIHISYWYDCQGVQLCVNGCTQTRGAMQVKVLYNGCDLRVRGF